MDHEACTVHGMLAMLLYMSRVLGLTPVRLTRVRGGYQVTMSRPAAVYCCVCTFSAHVYSIIGICLSILKSFEQNTKCPTASYIVYSIIIIITGIGSYGGVGRVRRIINDLVLLQNINYDINGNYKIKQNRKALFAITTYMIVWIVLFGFTHYFTFQKISLIEITFHITFFIESYNYSMLEVENALLTLGIHCAVRAITMKLRTLIKDTNNYNASPAACRSAARSVHDLMKSYVSCCDLARRLNASRGLLLYLLFSSYILNFMLTVCNLIDALALNSPAKDQNIVICLQLLWCGKYLLQALLFIEPWHLIQEELMYNVTPVGKSVPLQLDLMFKQLLLNEPTMTPLRMFTVQRSLLITGVGFISTYLVILIQCLQSRWK